MPLTTIFAALAAGAGTAVRTALLGINSAFTALTLSASRAAASVSSFSTATAGVGSTVSTVQDDNEGLIQGIAQLAFLVGGSLTDAFELAKQVALGFYNAVIGANNELQKQITQNAVVFSQSVRLFDVFGNQISDTVEEIQALQVSFERLIRELDFETRDIVGATDARTRQVLENVVLQTSFIVNQAEGFEDLEEGIKQTTIALTSAFGTFNLPDFQIPQEIRALLQGDVNNPDATLARQLQVSKQEFEKAAGEGRVLQLILEKTRSVTAGNVVAAESLTNSFSNIKNIVETIFLRLGQASFPVVQELVADFAKFLASSEDGIINLALSTGKVVSDALKSAIQLGQNLARLITPVIGLIGGLGDALAQSVIPGFQSIVELVTTLTNGLLGVSDASGIVATNVELIGSAAKVTTKSFNFLLARLQAAVDRGKTLLGIRLALKLAGKESITTAEAAKELREQQERNAEVIISQLATVEKKVNKARLLPEGSEERKRAEAAIQLFVENAQKRLKLLENTDFGAFDGEREKLAGTTAFINARLKSIEATAESSGVALEKVIVTTGEKIANEGSLVQQTIRAIENGLRSLETIAPAVERQEAASLLLSNIDKAAQQGGVSLDELAEKLRQLASDDRNAIDIRIEAQQKLLDILKQQEGQLESLIDLENLRAELAKFEPGADSAINTREELDREVRSAEARLEGAQRRFNALRETEISEQRSELRLLEEQLRKQDADFRKAQEEGRTDDAEFARKKAAELIEDLNSLAANDVGEQINNLGNALNDALASGNFNIKEIAKEFEGLDKNVIDTAIELKNLQLEIDKLEAERPTRIFQAALQEFSRVTSAADAARQQVSTERNAEIERLVRQTTITEEEAAIERIKVEQATSTQQIKIAESRLEALQKLELSSNPEERAQQELEIQQARNEVAQLRLQQIQQEGQLEASIRQNLIATLQTEIEQRQRIEQVQQQTLDLEVQRGEFVVKSLDRQLNLIRSRNELSQAFSDLEVARADKRLSDIEKAIQLNQELQNPRLAKSRRREIRQELEQLGAFGSSQKELEERRDAITKQRQEIEERIAEQREQAEAKSLEFELRKQELALKRQEIEAQISIQRARAEAASLEAEKTRAKLDIRDPELLAPVLEALNQQQAIQNGVVKLREAELGLIKQQQVDQQELAKNQRRSLEASIRAAQIRSGREETGVRPIPLNADQGESPATRQIDKLLNDLRSDLDKFKPTIEELNEVNKDVGEQLQQAVKEANSEVASEVRKSTQAIREIPGKLAEVLKGSQPSPEPTPQPQPLPEDMNIPAANTPLARATNEAGVLPQGISQGLAEQLREQNFNIKGASSGFDRFVDQINQAADRIQQSASASQNSDSGDTINVTNNFPSFDAQRFNLRLSGK